ncbi:MAG TPA: hypothetical protein EYP78_05770 [Candidatus Omnitrophica bacterium]|nr:hypothetical protein [Candidatus Omnitrophota bacterium]
MKVIHWLLLIALVLFFSGCATLGPSPGEKELRMQIEKLRAEKEALAAERDAYKGEAERLSRETGDIRAELAKLKALLSEERNKVQDFRAKISALSKEVQSMMAETVYERPEVASEEFNKKVQLALYTAGFDPGKIDGIMGHKTKQAIKEFQKANGLKVDGIVGRETWEKLKEYLKMK